MMFALCTAVTRLRFSRVARLKAYSAIRRLARSVMIFRVSTTPGTTSCSIPEYIPSVFSRTTIRSTPSKGVLRPGMFRARRTQA